MKRWSAILLLGMILMSCQALEMFFKDEEITLSFQEGNNDDSDLSCEGQEHTIAEEHPQFSIYYVILPFNGSENYGNISSHTQCNQEHLALVNLTNPIYIYPATIHRHVECAKNDKILNYTTYTYNNTVFQRFSIDNNHHIMEYSKRRIEDIYVAITQEMMDSDRSQYQRRTRSFNQSNFIKKSLYDYEHLKDAMMSCQLDDVQSSTTTLSDLLNVNAEVSFPQNWKDNIFSTLAFREFKLKKQDDTFFYPSNLPQLNRTTTKTLPFNMQNQFHVDLSEFSQYLRKHQYNCTSTAPYELHVDYGMQDQLYGYYQKDIKCQVFTSILFEGKTLHYTTNFASTTSPNKDYLILVISLMSFLNFMYFIVFISFKFIKRLIYMNSANRSKFGSNI